ncbi:MAG: recombinase family protein, partial [Acidimicrobiia bacterium]
MTNAAAYVRISQDREGEGLGVARQQQDCMSFISKHGWELTEVYVDNDVSAFSGRCRPGYERLMADIRAGTVDAVVAWHPDRLHRSPRELEDFIETIERTRTTVATVTAGDYDLSTPDGRLMARIVGSVARKESEDKSRRLRRKHQELAERGKLSGGGRRPFGFEADRVTLRDDEADLIRDAAQRVLAGESLMSVINDWNERGVATVTGAHWSTTTLKRLLRSGRISGQREHNGRIVAEAQWPAIITPEQTQALRAILDDRSRDRSTREPRSYLLSGFVWCGRCRTRMTTRPTGRGVPRYICAKSRGGCGRCGIAAEGLESHISDEILKAF